MKRISSISIAIASMVVLAACGRGEVVVQAMLDGPTAEDGEAQGRPLANLQVRLLPYDRDAVFDSLQTAYPEPEPQVPDTLLQLQDQIAAAQQRWQQAEHEWGEARERLQALSDSMANMNTASPEYRLLFLDFDEVDGQVAALEQATGEAFEEMTSLQQRLGSEGAELRMAIQQWEDQAFTDLDIVIAERLEASGREEYREVTDRNGNVRFQVPAGTWWVTARYDGIPFRELYWNIQVEVTRDGPVPIQLSPENAEVRPRLGG